MLSTNLKYSLSLLLNSRSGHNLWTVVETRCDRIKIWSYMVDLIFIQFVNRRLLWHRKHSKLVFLALMRIFRTLIRKPFIIDILKKHNRNLITFLKEINALCKLSEWVSLGLFNFWECWIHITFLFLDFIPFSLTLEPVAMLQYWTINTNIFNIFSVIFLKFELVINLEF